MSSAGPIGQPPARTVADVLRAAPPPVDALALARDVVAAVAALHGRGGVHGGLAPGRIVLGAGGVLLAAPAGRDVLGDDAGDIPFTAPEVLRGRRAGRGADVFAAGALVRALLAGAPRPVADPLEAIRRALHPARGGAGEGLPVGIAGAVRAALEPRRWRRARSVRRLLRALEEEVANATVSAIPSAPEPAPLTPPLSPRAHADPWFMRARGEREEISATSTSTSTPTPTPTATRPARWRSPRATHPARSLLAAPSHPHPLWSSSPAAPRPPRENTKPAPRCLRAPLPAKRAVAVATALAAVVATLALALGGGGDAALAGDVADRLARHDLAGAHALLDGAERAGHRGPLVEKLRGDVAIARGAAGEGLRRYRVALAADPALRSDAKLRENARKLLARADRCDTKRAAAELLGQLRDPAALPALREAKRSSGLLGFLCTGDALDRAIVAIRSTPAG
ncbi:serine/threonine-protein kinase [Anaeromyxobacter oryzae]|uniref:Protein kinase domain-containing protein n=1 Tax=Anaeromyxobacter oryzae TaxID=2918170 RepID=A0ABM7WNH9_9BACT|nr:serine/threonine protein kinase [Anaeromyxobacter oryzae]BDG01015.1 hypothetical protein AMOR_00110 [Anaeromyxobacter oryzae]